LKISPTKQLVSFNGFDMAAFEWKLVTLARSEVLLQGQWRLSSSGMWKHVVWQTGILEECQCLNCVSVIAASPESITMLHFRFSQHLFQSDIM
jgi:hypothetical protein